MNKRKHKKKYRKTASYKFSVVNKIFSAIYSSAIVELIYGKEK